MANRPLGRAGAGGHSPRLGARDPRVRTNAAGQVNDADHAPGHLERDNQGRTRVAVFDSVAPLATNATLAQVIAKLNEMIGKARAR